MSINDIIMMSRAGVGKDIIILQMDVTHSKFKPGTADLIRLKNEGVAEEVIEYMVGSDFTPDRFSWEHGYAPFDFAYILPSDDGLWGLPAGRNDAFRSSWWPYYPPFSVYSNLPDIMSGGHRVGKFSYQPDYARYVPHYPLSGVDYFPGRYHYIWGRYRPRLPVFSAPEDEDSNSVPDRP